MIPRKKEVIPRKKEIINVKKIKSNKIISKQKPPKELYSNIKMNIKDCFNNMLSLGIGKERQYQITDLNEIVDIQFFKNNNSKNIIICFDSVKKIDRYCLKKYPIFTNAIGKKDVNENLIIVEEYIFKYLNNIPPNDVIFNRNLRLTGWHCLSQNILKAFLQKLNTFYNKKFILIGGSSGGFASLFYSSFIPDSICLTLMPQIFIEDRLTILINIYKTCKIISNVLNNILEKKITDIRQVYNNNIKNNIIYIISNESLWDVKNINIFLNDLLNKKIFDLKKILLKMDYWGVEGHSSSIPKQEWVLWVNSVLLAKYNDTITINKKYLELKNDTPSV